MKRIFLFFVGAALILLNACNASHPPSDDKSSSSTKKNFKKKSAQVLSSNSPSLETGSFTYNAYRHYRIAIDTAQRAFQTFTNFCDFNEVSGKTEFRTESERFDFAMGTDSLFLTRNNSTEVYYNKNATLNGRWDYVFTCENNECVGLPQGTSMSRIFSSDSMTFIVTWDNYCFMDAYESFDVHPTTDVITKTNCREGTIQTDSTHIIQFRLESLTEEGLVYSYSLESKICKFHLQFGNWTKALCNEADSNSEYLGVGYRYSTNTEEFNQCMKEMYSEAGLSTPQL